MWYDVYVGVHVVAGVLTGAWVGMSRMVSQAAALVLGFALALPLAGAACEAIGVRSTAGSFLLFAASYAAVALACALAGRRIRSGLRSAGLAGYDRHMGAFLGAFHMLALAAVGSLVMANLERDVGETIRSRPAGRLVARAVDGLREVLPADLDRSLAPYLGALDLRPPTPESGG